MESGSTDNQNHPPRTRRIESGLSKEVFQYEWVIQNFDAILQNDNLINQEGVTFVGGESEGHPLKWTIFLASSAEGGERSAGIFYRLQNYDGKKMKEVLSRFEVKVMNKDNAVVRALRTRVNDITKQEDGLGLGWNKVFSHQTIGNRLVAGSLVLHVAVEVYTMYPPKFQGWRTVKYHEAEANQKLTEALGGVFNSDNFSDVKLITSDGKEYNGHKAILTARSSTLNAMFGGNLVEGLQQDIEVNDISGRTMKVLLYYIYTGRILSDELTTAEEIVDLADAATKYRSVELLLFCDSVLAKLASLSGHLFNPCQLFASAQKLRLERTEKAVKEYIKHNFQGGASKPVAKNISKENLANDRPKLLGRYQSGLSKQEYSFEWVVENFEYLIENQINAHTVTIDCGRHMGHPLIWTIYMTACELNRENWINLYYKLEKNNNLKFVYSRLEVKVMSKTRAIFRKLTSDLMDMTERPNFCWDKFINRTKIGDTATLVDGSLVLNLRLEVYKRFTPQLEALSLEERFPKMSELKLSTELGNLFKSARFGDVRIITKGDVEFEVHKIILAARSPVFAAMFAAKLVEEQSGIIRVDDVDGNTMKVMLRYIYTARISQEDLSDSSKILDLAYAAEKYDIKILHRLCDQVLSEKAEFSNATGLLLSAHLLRLENAEEVIADHVKQHWEDMDAESISALGSIMMQEQPKSSATVKRTRLC